MANNVFANGRELSCKSGAGKSIAAFPDVCMTPPENPTTPPGVPVPYPNTGMAKDTTKGSRSVKITGKEVMLKNKSYFKKSMGDEAGRAAKKGVVTSVNTGKVYYTSWSSDVKIEGENAVRHFDMTTHNHASPTCNTPPWMFIDTISTPPPSNHPCKKDIDKAQKACKGAKTTGTGSSKSRDCNKAADPKGCKKAMKCVLVPKSKDKELCCAPGNTGHHLVEGHCFRTTDGAPLQGLENYSYSAAPTVCVDGTRNTKEHGKFHLIQQKIEAAFAKSGEVLCTWSKAGPGGSDGEGKWRYKDARSAGLTAHKAVFPHCDSKCTKAQLDDYHKGKVKVKDNDPVRIDPNPPQVNKVSLSIAEKAAATKGIKARFTQAIQGALGIGRRSGIF